MKTKPNLIGKRIRLDACTDIHTKLQHGDEGVVMNVDDTGTVHVLWDNGSILGLLTEEGDAFSVLEDEEDEYGNVVFVVEETIGLEQKRTIRELQKTNQFQFAEHLITELESIDPDIDISPFVLLDALGCAGLSLTIGTDASRTWIESLK